VRKQSQKEYIESIYIVVSYHSLGVFDLINDAITAVNYRLSFCLQKKRSVFLIFKIKMSKSNEEIYDEFYELVNMTPSELEDWLDTEKSKNVGQDSGDGEAIGHKSGKKIIEIKRTKKDDLTDANYDHMNKVVGYIKRHKAQKPDGDIKNSDWRYSLKNWGHDPMKD